MSEKAPEFKEIDVFQPDRRVKLENGQEIQLPKLTWGRECKLLRIISDLVSQPPFKGLKLENATASTLISVLPQLAAAAAPKLTEFVAVVTGKDKAWVEDNCSLNDILEITIPFFAAYTNNLAGKVDQLAKRVQSPQS